MKVSVIDTEGKEHIIDILEGDKLRISDKLVACNTDMANIIGLEVIRDGKAYNYITIAFV